MKSDHISNKTRSVSATSSSGESVVLHTPVDEPDLYPSDPAPPPPPHHHHHHSRPKSEDGDSKKDYPAHRSGAPLLDHSSRLRGPDLGEVGYNLDYLPPRHLTPVSNPQELSRSRRIITGSEFGLRAGYVIRFKRATRRFWAEFFGTALLALFGTAVNHQVALGGSSLISSTPTGSYVSVAFGWALAVMLGVVVSGGISGGHLNPAVTLALAIFRGFSWGMVPIYWLAQFSGAVFGSALVYWNYSSAINIIEGGSHLRTINATGGLFFTNPLPYVSNFNCFYNEFLMTAILMMFIGNVATVKGLGPFIIFWVVFGLASSLGMQTSFALNPARDIGPRILTWFAGYGNSVWSIRNCYWFTVATLGPVFGAIVGCLIYDLFLATEDVPDCLLHGTTTMPSVLKIFRPTHTTTPLGDPEKHLTTPFEKKRRTGVGLSRMTELGSAKTSSHRYVSLNA